jgi:hypothetical protein
LVFFAASERSRAAVVAAMAELARLAPSGAKPPAQPGGCAYLLALPAGATDLEQAEDERLRLQLAKDGRTLVVLYGSPTEQARQLLHGASIAQAAPDRREGTGWQWVCDKCSDPACEWTLFRALGLGSQGARHDRADGQGVEATAAGLAAGRRRPAP